MTEKTMTLNDTIKPKSDQLNYDDTISGPITVEVTGLAMGGEMQPVIMKIKDLSTGEDLQPFKPCKSMRRVLISAWGDKGKLWIGKSMTIYGDPDVKYAGKSVGGLRISHMSGLQKELTLNLTATRGVRKPFTVKPLEVAK